MSNFESITLDGVLDTAEETAINDLKNLNNIEAGETESPLTSALKSETFHINLKGHDQEVPMKDILDYAIDKVDLGSWKWRKKTLSTMDASADDKTKAIHALLEEAMNKKSDLTYLLQILVNIYWNISAPVDISYQGQDSNDLIKVDKKRWKQTHQWITNFNNNFDWWVSNVTPPETPEQLPIWYGQELAYTDPNGVVYLVWPDGKYQPYADMKDSYEGLIKSYFKQNKKKKINSVFKKYLDIYKDDNVMRKYYINNLYEHKNYKSAITEINKYNLYSDKSSKMDYMLARCYFKTENYKKAVIHYRKILSENPDNVNYLMSYSYCLEKLDKSKEALEILEKSVSYFKNNIRILLTLGVIYFKNSQYEKAMKFFQKVLEINSKDWRAYYNISQVYEVKGMTTMADKFMKHSERYKKMLDK